MLKNSLIYFVLFNLLLVKINCQMVSLNLSLRYLHTTTFIDNKLYISGGRFLLDDSISILGRDFFYIDFSSPFNTHELKWKDLSSTNFVPQHRGSAAVKAGFNNDTLFLYGGNSTYDAMASVYTFSPITNSWGIPNIMGNDVNNVNRKALLTGIADNGKMYLWGGTELISNYNVNDMLILDTMNLSWGTGSLVNAPTPRSEYGATLLPDHKIIYMGGYNGNSLGLNEVYIYDTINDNWVTQQISGQSPSNRLGFSANLGLDGQRVIIFGGFGVAATDALYVLNLTNFKWYIPKTSENIPASRSLHRADVIGNYLVITFGIGYIKPNETDVLLLDIRNNEEYLWTSNFSLSDSSPPSSSPPTLPKLRKNVIIGASLVSGMLLIVGIYFSYRWIKNRRSRKNAIHPPIVKLDNQSGQKVDLTVVNDNGSKSNIV